MIITLLIAAMDSESVRRQLRRPNEGEGNVYHVIATGDGAQALDLYRDTAPDCLIVGTRLGDMTTRELLSMLQGESNALPLPTLMLTGREDPTTAASSAEIRVHEYLALDQLSPQALHLAIRSAMFQFQLHHERLAREQAEAAGRPRETRADRSTEQQPGASPVGEAFTRRVLDNLYAFVGVLAPDGTLLEANRPPLEAAGLTADEVVGKKFWDCPWWSYDTEIQAQLKDAVGRALQGEIMRYDVPVRMAGDSRMWIDFQLVPLRDAFGKITHLVPSAVDITERRAAEGQLRQSESTLRSFYESAPLLMGVVELPADDGDILHVYDNPATELFFGQASGSTAGRTARELGAPDETIQMWAGHYRQAERTESPVRFEYAHPRLGGETWLSVVVAWIGPCAGGWSRFSYVGEDITEPKRLERKERSARNRAIRIAGRLERLQRVTAALSAAISPEDVAAVIIRADRVSSAGQ